MQTQKKMSGGNCVLAAALEVNLLFFACGLFSAGQVLYALGTVLFRTAIGDEP